MPKKKNQKPLDAQLDAILRSDGSPTEKLAAFTDVFSDAVPQWPHLARQIQRDPTKVRNMLWQLIQTQDAANRPLQTLPPALPREPLLQETDADTVRLHEERLKATSQTTVLERGGENEDTPMLDEELEWKKKRDTALEHIAAKENAAHTTASQRRPDTDSTLHSLHRALREITYALEDEKMAGTSQTTHTFR